MDYLHNSLHVFYIGVDFALFFINMFVNLHLQNHIECILNSNYTLLLILLSVWNCSWENMGFVQN